jgi:L-arabinose isomerase
MLIVPTGHPQDPEVSQRLSEWSSVGATLVATKMSKLRAAADNCRRS